MPDLNIPTPDYDPSTAPKVASPSESLMPTKADVTQAQVQTYKPGDVEMDSNATVAGQMEGLLSKSNPYIDQARTKAAETANERGLLNSSLAAGAGERAAREAALPIAQQDAQTYSNAALANQQAATETELSNVAAQNRITEAETALSAEKNLAQQQASLQEQLMAAETASQKGIMALDANIKAQLGAIQQDYAVELENLSQSYEIQKNQDTAMGTMYDGALRSIATVLNDPDMTTAQSTSAVKVLIDNLGAGLRFLSGLSSSTSGVGYS